METKVTKFSHISNHIFLLLSVFLLVFIWVEFYLHSINQAFYISIIITLVILLSYYPLIKLSKLKKISNKSTLEEKEHLQTQLLFGNNNIISNFLLTIFDLAPFNKVDNEHYRVNNNHEVYFFFDNCPLNQNQINSIIRKSLSEKIYIFCLQNEKYIIPENTDIEIINLNNIYNKIKEKDTTIPTNITIKKKAKYSPKEILCIIFNKDRARGYFYSSILLIITSLFTPLNTYYIIMSTTLILLAIYSKFNNRFN